MRRPLATLLVTAVAALGAVGSGAAAPVNFTAAGVLYLTYRPSSE
jgi:hypothetical protein